MPRGALLPRADAREGELGQERKPPGSHRHERELEPERAEDGCRQHVGTATTVAAVRNDVDGCGSDAAAKQTRERENTADEVQRGVPLATPEEAHVRAHELEHALGDSGSG